MEKLKAAAQGLSSGGAGSSFATKLSADVEKATVSADKLEAKLKGASEAGGRTSAFSAMTESMDKTAAGGEKLNSSLKESVSLSERLASAQDKVASSQNKAAADAEKASNSYHQAANDQPKTAQSAAQFSESSAKSEGSWGKIKGAVKDSFAMFSVGMLGAQAVTGAVDGAKGLVSSGFEGIKERQAGQAMWATSIQDAHPEMSDAQLNKQSAAANIAMLSTSIKAGNSFEEANSMAKQIYSSDAGSYSGNLKKTQDVVTGMFNIQDANSLTQREMEQFKTAVGNIGDLGKMTGNGAKSLNLLDGKITRSIRDEYKRRNGHELGKNKSGNWDYEAVNAETAFAGLDKYGNSGGVGKASERYNSTIGGVARSVQNGLKNMATSFETTFGSEINKSFGGKGGLLSKTAGFFNNQKQMDSVATDMAKASAKVADAIGKMGKEAASVGKDLAPLAQEFASGFGKGFTSTIKGVINDAKTAYNGIKSLGQGAGKLLPKGLLSDIGAAAGKVTAFAVAMRGFQKLPGMGSLVSKAFAPFSSMLGKLGGVGKTVDGLISKVFGIKPKQDTAGDKMMGAANKIDGAADKMNGKGITGPESAANVAKNKAASSFESTLSPADYVGNGGRKQYQIDLAAEEKSFALSQGRSGRMIAKGESMLESTGPRMAQNVGWMTKLKGNSLIKLGGIGEKIGGSFLGSGVSKLGSGIAKVTGGLSKAGSF
ncbi:hypothetical protein [Lacticaseibacillus saniviri]|uniref:hypothetical protein n=1 Tax=Lacticaseibacillus saniviri TaxID=931533 RepID=UPI0012E32D01|nr:hypothetical protein [Lacticaseibacillus saniviri]